MSFSVVVSVFGDNPNRHRAFKGFLHCLEEQINQNFEFVMVEQVIDVPYYRKYVKPLGEATKYIIVKSPDENFHFSWLRNIGAKEAKYDHLLFIDADLLFRSDYFSEIADFIKSDLPFFMGWDKAFYLDKQDSIRFNESHKFNFGKFNEERIRASSEHKWDGLIQYCLRDLYFDVGGGDEGFTNWGGEDNSLVKRILTKADWLYMPYTIYHMEHGNRVHGGNTERWNYTRQNVEDVIKDLKQVGCGRYEGPTCVNLEGGSGN